MTPQINCKFSFVKLDQPKRKRKARGQDTFLRTTSTTKTHTLWQRLTELMQPSPAKGCRRPAQLATARNICGIDVALREKTAVGGAGGTWNDGRMKDKLIWEFHKKRNFSTLLWLAMPGWSFLWCGIFVVAVRGFRGISNPLLHALFGPFFAVCVNKNQDEEV